MRQTLNIEEQFGFRLGLVARLWRAELDRRLAAFGLTEARWLTLIHLSRLPDAVTQRELAEAVGEALRHSRGAILQNHGLMAVGEDLRRAATRAAMIEETAKLALYVQQFGGEVTLLPPEWVERLGPLKDFL